MKQFIAISAIGNDRIGLVHDLSRTVADCGGSISESRMTALGADFYAGAGVRQLAFDRADRDRTQQARGDLGITIRVRRTASVRYARTWFPTRGRRLPRPKPVSSRPSPVSFLRGIDIGELSTRSYAAAHTGAPMFSVYMNVNVPSRIHVGSLREEFMDFATR